MAEENKELIEKKEDGKYARLLKIARLVAESDIAPDAYKKKPANVVLALDMAERMGVTIFEVMQNLNLIKGKVSWAAEYMISRVNATGHYSPIRYVTKDEGVKDIEYNLYDKAERIKGIHDYSCYAYVTEKSTGQEIHGITVSVEMAIKEGWYQKKGSKWQTLTPLMLQYRAATFLIRQYMPECMHGITQTTEEIQDIEKEPVTITLTPEQAAEYQGKDAATRAMDRLNVQPERTADPEPVKQEEIDPDDDRDQGEFKFI